MNKVFSMAMTITLLASSFALQARELPLNWDNPVKCSVSSNKATVKNFMDIGPDGDMDEISETYKTEVKLELKDSEYGVGRQSLVGKTIVSLDSEYNLLLSVTIDPTTGPTSDGDEMKVNSFLIKKDGNTIIGSVLDSSNHSRSGNEGNVMLSTGALIYNNQILSELLRNDISITGRLSSSRIDDEMKQLVQSRKVSEGTPWKIMINCQTINR